MASLKSVRIADPLGWLDSLVQADTLLALAAFVACVALAWCAVWLVRRAFREADLLVLEVADINNDAKTAQAMLSKRQP